MDIHEVTFRFQKSDMVSQGKLLYLICLGTAEKQCSLEVIEGLLHIKFSIEVERDFMEVTCAFLLLYTPVYYWSRQIACVKTI